MGSTFWTPKWGSLLATCLTILGDAWCGSFGILALCLLNRICLVGARYLMTSKAVGKSCVSAFVSAQRRPFVRAPVFVADLGPHFGVQKVAYLLKMKPTRAQSPSPPVSMILATIPYSCKIPIEILCKQCSAAKQENRSFPSCVQHPCFMLLT